MSYFKKIYTQYLSKLNKYVLALIVFVIITFMIGDSTLYHRYQYDEKIRVLEQEIKYYQKEIETNLKDLEDLNTNKESLERHAREKYYMKKSDEDIFIILD